MEGTECIVVKVEKSIQFCQHTLQIISRIFTKITYKLRPSSLQQKLLDNVPEYFLRIF